MSFTHRYLAFDGETATHYAKSIAFTKENGRFEINSIVE